MTSSCCFFILGLFFGKFHKTYKSETHFQSECSKGNAYQQVNQNWKQSKTEIRGRMPVKWVTTTIDIHYIGDAIRMIHLICKCAKTKRKVYLSLFQNYNLDPSFCIWMHAVSLSGIFVVFSSISSKFYTRKPLIKYDDYESAVREQSMQ